MSAFIALALLSGAQPIATIPQPARFDDWIASCDNARDCQVLASSEDWAENYWTVNVQRGAYRGAQPTVSIGPRFEDLPGAVRVQMGAQTPEFAFDDTGTLLGDPTQFLRALANATEAKIVDTHDQVIGRLPPKGASAALRWIDDQQEREDTVTALIAYGSKPRRAVPMPPALPTIQTPPASTKPPKKLGEGAIAQIKQTGECRSPLPWDHEYFRLDADHTLGLIACGLGAYQGWSMAVIIDEDHGWSPAKLEQTRDWSEELGAELSWIAWSVTSAAYIEDDQILSSFAKGRGLSDCGAASSWACLA